MSEKFTLEVNLTVKRFEDVLATDIVLKKGIN